ncbi:hypothetical protein [Crystallibacter degradans]|uniref:hypothetical protein n=1 Tax=Crystallibacter degradans TaxID=2726743 RepID=UPI001474CD02|nr:hypothetical protein [Arthrobacter sp. SF27]NMR32238.1 hypothetical protein [Arthrobacter sp. SF27]
MTDNTGTLDSTTFRSGDRVDIRWNGHSSNGYVEDAMPQLNVVWIRDLRTGERRMLSTDEYQIHHSEA